MMEPRIQYAKTSDGVSIAYWTIGEGLPLLFAPLMPSHCELEWHDPDFRSLFERLAKNRQLVRYDSRGCDSRIASEQTFHWMARYWTWRRSQTTCG